MSDIGDISNVSTNLRKICCHIAKDDFEISSHLEKVAYKFLFNSNTNKLADVDELHVINKIKKDLAQSNPAEVHNFELLYNSLKKARFITKPSAFLCFLYELQPHKKTNLSFAVLKDLKYTEFRVPSQLSVFSGDSKESVQKLFTAKENPSSSTLPGPTSSLCWSSSDTQSTTDISSSFRYLSPSETEIIQEIIYSFQGIEGKLLRKEPGTGGFIVDPRYKIHKQQSVIILRLAELGFLHNQLKIHCDHADKPIGLIGQSLVSVLREELTEYYRLIAILQSQLRPAFNNDNTQPTLSLHQLLVWVAEPMFKLQWLTNIALECQGKKGGALISSVFSFLHHGAPIVKSIAKRILMAVCAPMYHMLTHWILDGHLDDPSGEFFIESRSILKVERLWHDKYLVRENMLPEFITMNQAKKILATGKSINFLRESRQDIINLPGREAMQRTFENIGVEALFTAELCIELHKKMDDVYVETSKRVLDIMKRENRLIEHMQGFRRYLLLGQGDFIRYLLELIAPELSKPACDIMPHSLNGILDSAMRVTNTQFENPDTLKRLDVRLVEQSKGDMGWDVFTILYHTNGPIGTIFEPTLDTYRMLFGALWKAKRMEFVLSSMWKRQITSAKVYRRIPDISSVMQHIHILTAEMIHFIHQMQYYFLFEIVECSWIEMLNRVNQAESLDDIIKAHDSFLQSIKNGVFLNTNSEKLRTQLLTIYNTILKLETIEEALFAKTMSELSTMDVYDNKVNKGKLKEGFNLNEDDDKKNLEKGIKFNLFLQSIKTQVRSIAKQYTDHVRIYLLMLSSQPEVNLQLLSVRLDFNDYYNKMESQSCQYSSRRFSDIGTK